MNTLDRFFDLAQISGSVDIHCLLEGEWNIRHEEQARGQGRLHIVVAGTGTIHIDGHESAHVQAGDIIFFPRAAAHNISSTSTYCPVDISPIHLSQAGSFVRKSTHEVVPDKIDMELFCGGFSYSQQSDLFANLPTYIKIHSDLTPLSHIIRLLQAEALAGGEGSVSIINALSTVLLVLIVRQYLEQEDLRDLTGILRAWQNTRLKHVIHAVLDAPQAAWSVDELSQLANLSRAQFMRLFKQETGLSPHIFVTQIRLQQAAKLLQTSNQSVLSIALSVGLQSETHFGKLFKKYYGLTPGAYRQQKKPSSPLN